MAVLVALFAVSNGLLAVGSARNDRDDWPEKVPVTPEEVDVIELAPVSPDTYAVSVLALMNSRGDFHFRLLCGWLLL